MMWVPTTFNFDLDDEVFVLLKSSDSFKPSETKEIVVKYETSRDDTLASSKLTVTATTGDHIGTQWIMYIQGSHN